MDEKSQPPTPDVEVLTAEPFPGVEPFMYLHRGKAVFNHPALANTFSLGIKDIKADKKLISDTEIAFIVAVLISELVVDLDIEHRLMTGDGLSPTRLRNIARTLSKQARDEFHMHGDDFIGELNEQINTEVGPDVSNGRVGMGKTPVVADFISLLS